MRKGLFFKRGIGRHHILQISMSKWINKKEMRDNRDIITNVIPTHELNCVLERVKIL